jgi:hypothetical protein
MFSGPDIVVTYLAVYIIRRMVHGPLEKSAATLLETRDDILYVSEATEVMRTTGFLARRALRRAASKDPRWSFDEKADAWVRALQSDEDDT